MFGTRDASTATQFDGSTFQQLPLLHRNDTHRLSVPASELRQTRIAWPIQQPRIVLVQMTYGFPLFRVSASEKTLLHLT